jgi:hypothetical protein
MGMGYGNRRHAAERLNGSDTAVVNQGNTVPQHVAIRRPDVESSLANGELGLGDQADELGTFHVEPVPVGRLEVLQYRPSLPFPADVLALVLTNRTTLRR